MADARVPEGSGKRAAGPVRDEVEGAGRDLAAVLGDGREAAAEIRKPLDEEDRAAPSHSGRGREEPADTAADDDEVEADRDGQVGGRCTHA